LVALYYRRAKQALFPVGLALLVTTLLSPLTMQLVKFIICWVFANEVAHMPAVFQRKFPSQNCTIVS